MIVATIKVAAILVAAHSWYSPECCGGKDCHPVPDGVVQETKDGIVVRGFPMLSYTDPRLTPLTTLSGSSAMSNAAITGTWDLGTGGTTSYQAQYSDLAGDPNASNPGALATNYQGLSSDVNRDGVPDFIRYWNVYAIDLASSGTPNGLFIQIIVRWKQPGFGYRQITASKFKRNPTNVF